MKCGVISNSFLTITVSELGAELQSIKGADGTEYLWQGAPEYWSGRALNIFPYVARLNDGKYWLDGKMYEMPIHGFAPYSVFSLKEQEREHMIWELSDTAQTRLQYPRQFLFQVIYILCENCLQITYRVENRDEKPLYFGLGGHPGFNVPLSAEAEFSDYYLIFAENTTPYRVGFTSNKLRSGKDMPFRLEGGKRLPLHHALFDDDAIILKDAARKVTLKSEKDNRSISVVYPGMPYLGIWHCPQTEAPYVCIEPWSSLPANDGEATVFEKQEDLLCLRAGEIYENSWTIQINV